MVRTPAPAVRLVGLVVREVDAGLARTAVRNAALSMVENRRRSVEEARALRDLAALEAARTDARAGFAAGV